MPFRGRESGGEDTSNIMKVTVTGGRGFIGSHFVEEALKKGWKVHDIDKMGYASHQTLPWDSHPNYSLTKKNISELKHLPPCDLIVNFAAESHVDNSIKDSYAFIESSVTGVWNILEILRGRSYSRPLFFHISTDEVYGDTEKKSFEEEDRLKPSNPYSATKACAEMLIIAYARTYGIDHVITRSSNNYGERQYPEKLIPKSISCLENDRKIPVHGNGSPVRDWLYVKDNIKAIFKIIESGVLNECYNIGAENFMTNLEVVKTVLGWYGKGDTHYELVPERWGQDVRYAIDISKLKSLGWEPEFNKGIHKWF